MSGIERYIKEIHPEEKLFINVPINPDLPKILVVEDDVSVVDTVVNGIRSCGFDTFGLVVHLAYENDEASATITREIIHKSEKRILVIDYGLGGIDTRDILDSIPEDTRVIITSGGSGGLTAYENYRELHDKPIEIVPKPASYEEIVKKINNPPSPIK